MTAFAITRLSAASALRSRPARIAFLGVAVIVAVVAIVSERDRVSDGLSRVSIPALAGALSFGLMYLSCAALSWRALLSGICRPVGLGGAARIFFPSLIGKYLPGGIGNFVAAAELGRDVGLTRRQTLSTLVIALIVALTTGTLLALLLLPLAGGTVFARYWWTALAILPGLAALHPAVLRRLLAFARVEPDPALGFRAIAPATAWALVGWVMAGAQIWLLATAIGAPPTLSTLALAIGSYALAWTVGFLVLIAPGGFGPREATLSLLLASIVTPAEALVIALLSRLVMTAAEVAAALLTLAFTRR